MSLLAQLVDVGDEDDGGLHGDPKQRQKTQNGGNAEGSVSELERNQRSHRLRHDHSQGNGDREFEIAVERKQDHENQHNRERADKVHLRLGREKLAVFAAPVDTIARRQVDDLTSTAFWPPRTRALQIAPFDAVLHADVARIILAIDKRRAVPLT